MTTTTTAPATTQLSTLPQDEGSRLAVVKAVGGSALSSLGWAGGVAASYVGERVSTYVSNAAEAAKAGSSGDAPPLRVLGGSEILRIANTLDGIFSNSGGALKPPEVPRLVVVGTQSSGKSSLLNGIMAADILPLGEQMVTRTPLSLQLFHSPDPASMRAEFGHFDNGAWALSQSIALQCPDPTAAQMEQIRRTIEAQTEAKAGAQKGVSHESIFLRIYSPYVPNLSLVDLPGLTMTALTDQGQPRDIKEQIRSMVSRFIEQERTIILLVCPARADLEADPAVELVKEFDPTGKRTVGVLTKVDLMNAGTDVSKYLTNAVSSELQLTLGYFAIRNRSPAEAKAGAGGLSVREGFGSEATYFAQHATYGRQPPHVRERLGVPALSAFLARVLLLQVKQHMPALIAEVGALVAQTEEKMRAMGPTIPDDEGSRAALLQTLLAGFCRDYVGALVEKRADVKTGRRIKDSFSDLQATLRDVRPFEASGDSGFDDAYLLEAVRDCEGNHLSFPIPPIELLEHMLQHPQKRPIRRLLPPCLGCLQAVHEELRTLCTRQLQQPAIARFPQLQQAIRETMEGLLDERANVAQRKLEELVQMEEAYIATDDPAFLQELQGAVRKHGQNGRPGEAIAGLHGLIRLHLKAWGCPPHSRAKAQCLRPLREAVVFQPEASRVDDSAAFDHSGAQARQQARRDAAALDPRRLLLHRAARRQQRRAQGDHALPGARHAGRRLRAPLRAHRAAPAGADPRRAARARGQAQGRPRGRRQAARRQDGARGAHRRRGEVSEVGATAWSRVEIRPPLCLYRQITPRAAPPLRVPVSPRRERGASVDDLA